MGVPAGNLHVGNDDGENWSAAPKKKASAGDSEDEGWSAKPTTKKKAATADWDDEGWSAAPAADKQPAADSDDEWSTTPAAKKKPTAADSDDEGWSAAPTTSMKKLALSPHVGDSDDDDNGGWSVPTAPAVPDKGKGKAKELNIDPPTPLVTNDKALSSAGSNTGDRQDAADQWAAAPPAPSVKKAKGRSNGGAANTGSGGGGAGKGKQNSATSTPAPNNGRASTLVPLPRSPNAPQSAWGATVPSKKVISPTTAAGAEPTGFSWSDEPCDIPITSSTPASAPPSTNSSSKPKVVSGAPVGVWGKPPSTAAWPAPTSPSTGAAPASSAAKPMPKAQDDRWNDIPVKGKGKGQSQNQGQGGWATAGRGAGGGGGSRGGGKSKANAWG